MTQTIVRPATRMMLSSATDEDLLVRYRDRRDIEAFETLVHRYEKPLYAYLLRYLHSASLADEVLQATFLRLHQKRHVFVKERRVRPWLYNIATHLAIDALRSEGRRHAASLDAMHIADDQDAGALLNLLESTSASPLEQLEVGERSQWVRKAVANLPNQLRVVLWLIYFQGFKFHEAAEALGLPLGTVKSRVHKALLLLSAAWRRNHRE